MATPAAPLTPAEEAYALAHTPGLAPPRPDIVPNFIDPYSRAYLIVTTTAVTLTVTTVLVLIRTYTKRFINKTGLGWDDYLSILAWVGFVAYASVGYQVVRHGGFVHQWNVLAIQVMKFLQTISYIYVLYCPVMFITKFSLLVQVLHIFAPVRAGTTYYLCHFMIWFNLLFYTAVMFVAIFICSPRAKFWDPLLPGTCVNINAVNIITSVINAISDILLLVLPISCVWKLQMSSRKKLGVSAVFATASFACVSSVMRIVTSVQVVGARDVTWVLLPEGLWALGEISGGISCGCMISLPQFFRHFIPKIATALSYGSRGKSEKLSAASGQADPYPNAKVAYPRSPYDDGDSYVELCDRIQASKPFDSTKEAPKVWSDEISVGDEEKGLTPLAGDVIVQNSKR